MISIRKTQDFDKIIDIRINIFHKELGISKEQIFDADDERLKQFLIMRDKKILGTFRLRESSNSYKIERMGILSKFRSKNFGKLTLDEIKAYAKKGNKSKIILDSIYDVRNFYAKSGFVITGDVYVKANLPHVRMIFNLS